MASLGLMVDKPSSSLSISSMSKTLGVSETFLSEALAKTVKKLQRKTKDTHPGVEEKKKKQKKRKAEYSNPRVEEKKKKKQKKKDEDASDE